MPIFKGLKNKLQKKKSNDELKKLDKSDEELIELADDIGDVNTQDNKIPDVKIDQETADSIEEDLEAALEINKETEKQDTADIKDKDTKRDGYSLAITLNRPFDKKFNNKDIKVDGVSVSQNKIDDAIERIINKIYAKKIETIFFDVVEKKVSLEIEKIKTVLKNKF